MGRWFAGFFFGFLIASAIGAYAMFHTARQEGTAFPPSWMVNLLPEPVRDKLPLPAQQDTGTKGFPSPMEAPLPFSLVDTGNPEDASDDRPLSGLDSVLDLLKDGCAGLLRRWKAGEFGGQD